jgi:hypothetical protein
MKLLRDTWQSVSCLLRQHIVKSALVKAICVRGADG